MFNKDFFRACVPALVLVLCSACASAPSSSPATANAPATLGAQFSAQAYPVAPTDELRLEVYRESDLSGTYYVDPSGTINVPLIGRIRVAGKSLETIEKHLVVALSDGYIVDPDVRVSIHKYRPIFITGEINRPGQYTFTPGMTVLQATVLAGGLTKFASKKYYLQRGQGGQKYRVDGNSLLFPGDIIEIGERIF